MLRSRTIRDAASSLCPRYHTNAVVDRRLIATLSSCQWVIRSACACSWMRREYSLTGLTLPIMHSRRSGMCCCDAEVSLDTIAAARQPETRVSLALALFVGWVRSAAVMPKLRPDFTVAASRQCICRSRGAVIVGLNICSCCSDNVLEHG